MLGVTLAISVPERKLTLIGAHQVTSNLRANICGIEKCCQFNVLSVFDAVCGVLRRVDFAR
jgi:hypothetical protein